MSPFSGFIIAKHANRYRVSIDAFTPYNASVWIPEATHLRVRPQAEHLQKKKKEAK